jgi:hypothetical protein
MVKSGSIAKVLSPEELAALSQNVCAPRWEAYNPKSIRLRHTLPLISLIVLESLEAMKTYLLASAPTRVQPA